MQRLLLILLVALWAAPAWASPPVSYKRTVINGVRAYVVTVDLNCKRIALVPLASNGHYKSFRRFIKESRPLAAINGTFFDPRTATIICNLMAGGKLLSEGRVGHSLRIDMQNKAQLVNTAGKAGRFLNLKEWAFGVSSGPTLLRSGQYIMAPSREGFRPRGGLFGISSRSAIGITKHNKLLLVTVRKPVRLQRLAWMMKSLGAQDALNLDGGSSSALYVDGRFVTRPRRLLTNVVAVTLRPVTVTKAIPPAEAAKPIYDELPPAVLDMPLADAPLDPEYLTTGDF